MDAVTTASDTVNHVDRRLKGYSRALCNLFSCSVAWEQKKVLKELARKFATRGGVIDKRQAHENPENQSPHSGQWCHSQISDEELA